VLIEIDARTGFTGHLTHAGGKVNHPPELKRNLLYVIIAEATNMGLAAMAESCGVPYDVLAWTAESYFRAETLEAANAAIVNYHHRLPLTQAFGNGTLSSSDGQRFPVKGKSLTTRHLSRYFARGQGISTYTHASDQHSTFDTKMIVATAPESHYVLDGILQPDRPAGHRARHRHPWRNNGQLRPVRPGRLAAVTADPRHGQDHLVPDRAARRVPGPLPVRRAAAHPPACMTGSTRSPRPRTPPSPGTASARRTCGRCWAASAWPATSRPPARAEHLAPARALPCPQAGRVTDHDHHGATGAAHRDTVSTAPPP
jgi:Tn3 transposase DDE domain